MKNKWIQKREKRKEIELKEKVSDFMSKIVSAIKEKSNQKDVASSFNKDVMTIYTPNAKYDFTIEVLPSVEKEDVDLTFVIDTVVNCEEVHEWNKWNVVS